MDDRSADKIHRHDVDHHIQVGNTAKQYAGSRHAGDQVVRIPRARDAMSRNQTWTINGIWDAALTCLLNQLLCHPFALSVTAEWCANIIEINILMEDTTIVYAARV